MCIRDSKIGEQDMANDDDDSSSDESDNETGAFPFSVAKGDWFVQPNASVAHLSTICAGKFFVPLCRNGEPYSRGHRLKGNGVQSLLTDFSICNNCFKRLPDSAKAEITDLLEDDELE